MSKNDKKPDEKDFSALKKLTFVRKGIDKAKKKKKTK
jgi:hypothetical protein